VLSSVIASTLPTAMLGRQHRVSVSAFPADTGQYCDPHPSLPCTDEDSLSSTRLMLPSSSCTDYAYHALAAYAPLVGAAAMPGGSCRACAMPVLAVSFASAAKTTEMEIDMGNAGTVAYRSMHFDIIAASPWNLGLAASLPS